MDDRMNNRVVAIVQVYAETPHCQRTHCRAIKSEKAERPKQQRRMMTGMEKVMVIRYSDRRFDGIWPLSSSTHKKAQIQTGGFSNELPRSPKPKTRVAFMPITQRSNTGCMYIHTYMYSG